MSGSIRVLNSSFSTASLGLREFEFKLHSKTGNYIEMNLELYLTELYNESKKFSRYTMIFLYLSLIFLVVSFYQKGVHVYIPAVFALFMQFISWYFSWKSKVYKNIANDIQVTYLLQKAYGNALGKFNISELVARIPNNIHIKVSKKEMENTDDNYESGETKDSDYALLKMIQENSFWNKHLYQASYDQRMNIFYIFMFLFSFAVIFSIPFIELDYDFVLVRIFLGIMSLSIIYEVMENTLVFKRSAQLMAHVDGEISRINDLSKQQLMEIFSKYVNINFTTPDIPDGIYVKNKDRLNKSWRQRVS